MAEHLIKKLSQADMVLVAIYNAAKGTTRQVPYEEIVIESWRTFPFSFGLRNHPEYPDSSDIHKRIYQNLKPQGLVITLGNKIFRLTDKGVSKAENLTNALKSVKVDKEKHKLSREAERYLTYAITSQAYSLWKAGEKEKLIDYDVKLFFQFSTGTKVEGRKQKVTFATETIEEAIKDGIREAVELRALSKYLIVKFSYLLEEG